MTINRILYVDDNITNGIAAMEADPRIDFTQGIQLIEDHLLIMIA